MLTRSCSSAYLHICTSAYQPVPLSWHAFHQAIHLQLEQYGVQQAAGQAAMAGQVIKMPFGVFLENGHHLLFFRVQRNKQGALPHGGRRGGRRPAHEVQYVRSAGDQGGAVGFDQMMAAIGMRVANTAGNGQHIPVIAVGNGSGNEGAALQAAFYNQGGVADAGYNAVALGKVLFIRRGAAHKVSEQAAIFQHGGGSAFMNGRVDAVQAMRQYANGGDPMLQRGFMRNDINAIGHAANDSNMMRGQPCYYLLAYFPAIAAGATGAYNAEDPGAVERGIAFKV